MAQDRLGLLDQQVVTEMMVLQDPQVQQGLLGLLGKKGKKARQVALDLQVQLGLQDRQVVTGLKDKKVK